MSTRDPYTRAGVVLMFFGVPFAVYSYFVLLDVTFTALGLASLVLGATALLVPSSPVPAGTVRAMVEGASVNVEALLEEYDASSKAYYLPPVDGRVYCYVPLSGGLESWQLERVIGSPIRVVTDVAGSRGLMVFPPGSEIVRLSLLGEESGLEDALSYVLVDYLEAVESVKAVLSGDRVVVQLNRYRVDTDFPRVKLCLGSIPVSTAGCVLAWVTGKPVLFVDEAGSGESTTATFRVMGSGQE